MGVEARRLPRHVIYRIFALKPRPQLLQPLQVGDVPRSAYLVPILRSLDRISEPDDQKGYHMTGDHKQSLR